MDTPVGLPDPSTLQAPPPGLPDPSVLNKQEDARQKFIGAYPDGPKEGDAALRAADALSPTLDPRFTVKSIGDIGESWWGKAKMKATELYDKVHGSIEGFLNHSNINALSARQLSTFMATGKEDPKLQEQIDEAKKTADPKKHLSTIPNAILSIPLGLGYIGVEAGSYVANSVAALMTLDPLQKLFPNMGEPHHVDFLGRATAAGEKFMGAFSGATYNGLREEGIPANIAAPFALGGGLLGAAAFGLKTDLLLEKAIPEASAKAALTGRFSRTARAMAVSGGAQGVLGAIQAGVDDTVYELAAITNNLVNQNKVPLKTVQQFGEDMGISGLAGAAFGAIAAIPAAIIPGGHLDTRIHEEAEKAEEAQMKAQAPEEVHPIEAATTEKMKSATVGDLVEKAPEVPKTEPSGANENAISEWRKEVRAAEDEYEANSPERKYDWTGKQIDLTPEELKQEEIALNRENERKTAAREILKRKPVEAKPAEPLRMTETEGAALDKATQSAEGTSDYIEKRPEIEKLNIQIEDLQAKVAAGKEEFKAQLDVAKADKVAAVKSLRDQIKKRAEVNTLIKHIEGVDTSEMSEKYKAPIEALRNSFNYHTPTEKTLSTLRDIREQLAADPEKKFPQEQLDRLEKLDKANFRQLSPEDMRLVHDAIMAYKNEWTHEHNVFLGEQRVEKQKAVNDTILAINRKPAEETKTLKSESNLTKAVQGTGHAVFDGLTELENMNTGVAMVAGEDSLLMGLQRHIREGHDAKGQWKDKLAAPINDWFEEKGINQRHWFREKTRFEVPSTDPTLHNMADITRGDKLTIWGLAQQEGGQDSLLNGIGLRRGKNPDVPVRIEPALLDSILSSVTDEEKSFMMDAFKKTTDMAWPELVKAFVRRFGREPAGVEGFYFMIDRMKGYIRGGSDDPFAQQFKDMYGTAVSGAHLTTRQASQAPVNVAPIQDLLQDHIQWASNYIALANPIAEFNKVMTDKNVGNAMRQKYGNDHIQKKILMGLNREAGAYVPTNILDKFANFFTRRGVTRGLGFNLGSSLINRILGVRAATYVRPGYVARGIIYSILHPRKTADLLSNVQLYKEISQKGASWEMAEAQTKTLAGKVADITFIPLKWGVRKSVQGEMLGGIWDAQDQMEHGQLNDVVRRNTGLTDEDLKGMSREEIVRHSENNAARVTEDTHATVRPYTQSFLSMRGGAIAFSHGSQQ